jgi:putative component of toxin-antitoxin plasmid stabilization module
LCIKEDPGLVRAAEEACKNMDVQKDINHLEEELAKGNENPGIGRKPICKGVIEHRGKNGGRLYVRESDDNEIEILAKSGKKKSNQQFVINRLKEIYG